MEPPHSTNKAGSALLVTLLVMGLMTMLVLAFSTHVRLELRNISNHQDQHLARANARLGLELALAQLQVAAGPDQRATAKAEILGGFPAIPIDRVEFPDYPDYDHRNVTGIWNTTSENLPPNWLISSRPGTTFNPADEVSEDESVLLVGPGTLGEDSEKQTHVMAPRVEILDQNGSYAYWIGDEGVKASIALTNPFDPPGGTTVPGLHETEIDRKRFTVPYRQRGELAFTAPANLSAPDLQDEKRKILSLGDFQHFGSGEDPRHNGGFHHFTTNARGLLINPIDGGIKKDLSMNPSLLGPGFEAFMDFPSYMVDPAPGNFLIENPADLRRMHRITPPTNLNPAPNEIVHSVVPIITDFGLQFSPRLVSNSDRRAMVSMRFAIELWNPYTTSLPAEDLVIEISGLQPITMHVGDDWTHTFNIPEIFGDPLIIRLNREQYHTSTILEPDSFDTQAHGAGRLLYWITPDLNRTPPNTASFSSNNSTQTILNIIPSPTPNFPGDSSAQVRYEMDETSLNIELRRAPENGGTLLGQYLDFEFLDVLTGDVNTLSAWNRRWLTYRFRIIERGTFFSGAGSPSNTLWLKHLDKRTPTPSFGESPTLNSHTRFEGTLDPAPDDDLIIQDLSMRQNQDQFIFDRVLSTTPRNTDSRRDIALFELPRQPLISLGQLQHLHIYGQPPYSIGNPWGGETWNSLFDEFFLSGIQHDISIPDFSANQPTLPHPRLTLSDRSELNIEDYDEPTLLNLSENSGVLFKINGSFNINSVSPSAWKAILSSTSFHELLHPMRNLNLYGNDQIRQDQVISSNNNYPVGFTRFPQSFHELFDLEISALERRQINSSGGRITNENNRVLATFKQVVNFFGERSTLSIGSLHNDSRDYDNSLPSTLLDTFAESIASAILQKTTDMGRPFFSVRELLTEPFNANGDPLIESVLQTGGLRRVYVPIGSTITIESPEERTPGWTSQADVITALAPFISTRSDTFTIRAYGNIQSENGIIISEAWAEAKVQRVISPLDTTSSLVQMSENSIGFGRKFKIISIKWLNKSDI